MNEAKKILDFKFSADDFISKSNYLINDATKRKIKTAELSLVSISDKQNHNKKTEIIDISKTYKMFMKTAPFGLSNLKNSFNSKRSVRKLASCLIYSEKDKQKIIDSKYYDFALTLIEDNFSKTMFLPLFMTLLEEWNHTNIIKIKNLIIQHKDIITNQKSRMFNVFHSHFKYYFVNGGIGNLCSDLVEENINLNEVFDFLELQESMIYFDFFSEVAETYTQIACRDNRLTNSIDSILDFLLLHENKDTNKKCLEKIINAINQKNPTEPVKQKLINFCYKHIGDPSYDSNWYHWKKANDKDKENLKNAQSILNQWLAHKFINLFFEKIAMDKDRKDFWMKYIDYITNFKIYMSNNQRYSFIINNDGIDSNILYSKIGLLEFASSSSSFIMMIKDYTIVEFSKTGDACYIYHQTNKYKPILAENSMYIGKLKHPRNRQMAIKANYMTNKDGRIMHNGNWQLRFKSWIKDYLEIEV